MDDRGVPDHDEPIAIDLTDEQRQVLIQGLRQWGGPAHTTDALSRALGWGGVTDQREQSRRLCESLAEGQPLPARDWTRILLTTEVAFASDVVGAGTEWQTVTGLEDVATLLVLRELQTALPVRASDQRS